MKATTRRWRAGLTAGGRHENSRLAVVDRINNGTASPLVFDAGRIFAESSLSAPRG